MAMEMFGKYEIRGKLGAGAMGTVHDAFDPVIQRRAALKTVRRPEPGDAEGEDAMARFKREAQAAGRLNHPNIVAVYDYGEDATSAWIAMELVEGGTLKDLLDRGERFPLPHVLRLMEQVLAALDYSHKRGVVHRDIKPANIMLTADNQVKIADFGIARIENSAMTQVGTIMGTPAYMAPEQLRGEAVDSRADIWAAGVVLYQMLTGEKPFAGGYSSVQHKAINTEPTPASALSVTASPAIDAVIGRAMAKRPEDRFATAADFGQALRMAAVAKPVAEDATVVATGTRVTPPTPTPTSAPKKGPPVALIAGGGALLVAGVVGFIMLGGSPAEAPRPTTGTVTTAEGPRPVDPSGGPTVTTRPAPSNSLTTAQPEPRLVPGTPGGMGTPTTSTGAGPLATEGPGTVAAPPFTTLGEPITPPVAGPAPGPLAGQTNWPPVVPNLDPPAIADRPIVTRPEPPAPATIDAKPAPEPVRPQIAALPPPRIDFRAAAAAAVGAPTCGLLATSASDNSLSIEGVLRRGEEAVLRRALREVPANATRLSLREFEGPYCDSFAQLRPILAPPDAAPRLRVVGSMPLLAGQLLRFDVTMPDWPGQLNVAYLMSDGNVAHLAAAQHPAGAVVRLGEPRAGFPGWDVSEPFGTDLMLAIISEGPLFAIPRPDVEPRQAYVAALTEALRAARLANRRVVARPLVVETAAR